MSPSTPVRLKVWLCFVLFHGAMACSPTQVDLDADSRISAGKPLSVEACEPTPPQMWDRSLFIHREDVLSESIPFEKVWVELTQGVPQPRYPVFHENPEVRAPVRLFRQWADTQNRASDAFYSDSAYPHCDDEAPVYALPQSSFENVSRYNDFAQHCPRPFGKYAKEIPLPHDAEVDGESLAVEPWFRMKPIALVNRMDLTPTDYKTCGEVRLVYHLDGPDLISGLHSPAAEPVGDELFFIMEAVIPNPQPGCRNRCRDFAQKWAELSAFNPDEPEQREEMVTRIEDILFEGVAGFEPVVRWQSFSGNLGQIRINDFVQVEQVLPQNGAPLNFFQRATPWSLRQFQLELLCRSLVTEAESVLNIKETKGPSTIKCELVMEPRPVTDSPSGELIRSAPEEDPRATAYAQALTAQLSKVINTNNINLLSLTFDTSLLPIESRSQLTPRFGLPMDDYLLPHSTLLTAINTQLAQMSNPFGLTAANVLHRANFLTCAGCHNFAESSAGNPNGFGGGIAYSLNPNRFFHVSAETLPCGSTQCSVLSAALKNQFIPHRLGVFNDFLNPGHGDCGTCSPEELPNEEVERPDMNRKTIGGRPVGGSHH